MFERKEENLKATPKESQKTTSLPKDVVVRVMPRVEKDDIIEPAVQKPVEKPKVVAPPPPPVAVKQPVKQPTKKRRPWWLTILLFVLMIGFFVGAILIYQEYVIPRIGQEDTPQDTQPEPEPEEEPEPEPEPEVFILLPGLDTDSDGLTDREESIYSTDLRNPDTDADSFLDGNEVFHRFDPLGPAPSTLLDTGTVDEFTFTEEEGISASLTYPRVWTAIETNPESGWVLTLQPLTSSRMTIRELTASEGQSTDEFIVERLGLIENLPTDFIVPVSRFVQGVSKNGYTIYTHPNSRLVYLETETNIYEFYYDVRTERAIEYLQTFQMIINSFKTL